MQPPAVLVATWYPHLDNHNIMVCSERRYGPGQAVQADVYTHHFRFCALPAGFEYALMCCLSQYSIAGDEHTAVRGNKHKRL